MIYYLTFLFVVGTLIMLSIKWELDKKISVSWALIMGACACLIVAVLQAGHFDISPPLQVLISASSATLLTFVAMLGLFFRDPERTPPAEQGVIVSPADGIVKYVKEIQQNEFPFALKNGRRIPLTAFTELDMIQNGGIQVGIGMSLLDVHVTRSPITGELSYLKRVPGKFKSLKNIPSLLENERVVGVIKGAATNIGIVLIASRLVRRIVMKLKEGQSVVIGQRIGMIRFGSQVDILIPQNASLKITVKPGEKVRAGETIIADI